MSEESTTLSTFSSSGDAEAYEQLMGRWSRRLAGPFIDFVGGPDWREYITVPVAAEQAERASRGFFAVEQPSVAAFEWNEEQAARISQRTAFFHLGRLVEMGETEKIFTNPSDPRTQDYITGRFG